MVKTRSMTRNHNHNHDDALSSSTSSRKRFKTFDNGGVAPWSDVDDDVLFIVMMKLGVVDFLAFSGVCKSWRSLALFNRNTFMASRPPMSLDMDPLDNSQDFYCYMKDFEGRRFKTILPHFAGRFCIGVTCGYLILFGKETRDFWLVNPITRHQLHFPDYPLYVRGYGEGIRATLVFSPSISGWVLVMLHEKVLFDGLPKSKISFCIAGKRGWNHVSSPLPTSYVYDLHAFKGKIYTLHTDCSLCELRLNLKHKCKWTLLETNSFLKTNVFHTELLSLSENLYAIYRFSKPKMVLELDFGEMKWVSAEKTIGKHAFFLSYLKSCAAIKPGSWAGPLTQYKSNGYFSDTDKSQQCMFHHKWMWYFPHDCLNVNLLDE